MAGEALTYMPVLGFELILVTFASASAFFRISLRKYSDASADTSLLDFALTVGLIIRTVR